MKQTITRLLLGAAGWLLNAPASPAQGVPAPLSHNVPLALSTRLRMVPAGAPRAISPRQRVALARPVAARVGTPADQPHTSSTETVTQAGAALINYQPASGFFFGLVDRAVDATGNTYLLGALQSMTTPPNSPLVNADFLLVKYSASGQRLWERRYDNYADFLAISSDDRPVALAIDAAGNILVAGSTSTFDRRISRAFAGFVTLKYSPAGSLIWTQRRQGDRVASVLDLVVDAAGNAYVEGSASSDIINFTFQRSTIKYSPAGQELWLTTRAETSLGDARQLAVDANGGVCLYGNFTINKYAGATGQLQWTAQSTSDINDVRVDAAGNVLTTGAAASDYATVKYAGATGQRVWEARYNGPANASDVGNALRIDAEGNVVVTGSSEGNTSLDMATLRYDGGSGQQQWVARYNGAANRADVATALALDPAGNVYVTGRSASSRGDNDFSTLKYSATGEQRWQIDYNGPNNSNDEATTIQVGATGTVFVGGGNTTVTYTQHSVQEGWAARFNGAANSDDLAVDMAIDGSGNVVVTGYSYNGSSWDYATAKYSASGQQQWAATYNGAASNDDLPSSVAVDATGNVYVTGTSYSGARGRYDYVTLKYSPTGQQLWETHAFASASSDDLATDVIIGPDGNPVVTGTSYGGSQSDYVTRKYAAANGTQVWAATYNGPANGYDLVKDLAVDAAGNVAVTGTSDAGTTSGYDYATVKYNGTTGQQQWVARHAGAGSSYDEATALTTDANNNVTVTGYADNGSGYDYTTLQYAPSGQLTWTALYNGPANSYDEAQDIAADQAGNVVVTGRSYNSSGNSDYATVKYGTNGQQLWATLYNGSATGDDEATALDLDAAGNVYVTGYSTTTEGTDDYATVQYSASGQQLWMVRYNGPGNSYDEPAALAVGAAGNVYVTGFSVGAGTGYDFATLQYRQSAGAGAALAASVPSTPASAPMLAAFSKHVQDLSVYPNPTVGQASVSFRPVQDGTAQVLVYNRLGRQVASLYRGTVRKGQRYTLTLDGQQLAPGLYTCSLLVDGQRETVRLVVNH